MPTADGYIVLSIGNDPTFQRLSELAGETKLLEDDRFKTNASRVSNREHVTKVLNEVTRRNFNQWLSELESKIGCGPINNFSDVFNDPHVISREMVMEMEHSKTEKSH